MLRYLPVFMALVIWSWAGVMIKYLQEVAQFDAYTQNFYRYAVSAVLMLAAALVVDRAGLRRVLRSPTCVLAGVLCAAYQTMWVLGLYYVYPTFASFIGRSNMIFTVVIGVAFFADERRLAANPRFLAALLVAMLGVCGVIAFHPDMRLARPAPVQGSIEAGAGAASTDGDRLEAHQQAGARRSLIIGTCLIVFGSGLWAAYVYGAKLITRVAAPLPSFAAASVFMAAVLLLVALVAQGAGRADLGHVAEVDGKALLVLFGSGVLCVGVGQVIYYLSVSKVGVAISQTVALASPLLVALNSYLIFGEELAVMQWLSGLALLAALAYVLWLENRLHRAAEFAGA